MDGLRDRILRLQHKNVAARVVTVNLKFECGLFCTNSVVDLLRFLTHQKRFFDFITSYHASLVIVTYVSNHVQAT